MKKVLIVATVQSHICQFHKNLIIRLRQEGYEVHVAAHDNLAEKNGLKLDFADVVHEIPFVRSPFKIKNNIRAYKALSDLLKINHYDIIHCNTPMGGVITRLAGNKYRNKGTTLIYMAHGFHFFKGAPKKNWILYYPVEKLLAYKTDVLITINHEDFKLAKSKMHARRIEYVPGIGIDIERFANCDVDKYAKRKELGIPDGYVWALSVGELLPDKNHKTAIKAMVNNPNVFYTIAGNGRLDTELTQLANEIGIGDRFKLLGYRLDVPELCNAADIFVFPSTYEGLPVALMEAMSSGLPIVCSNTRGSNDLVDNNGGFTINPLDVEALSDSVHKLTEIDTTEMKRYNCEKVKLFSKENVVNKLLSIYNDNIQ